jgi:DNA-binding transcriptional LysR family regulator
MATSRKKPSIPEPLSPSVPAGPQVMSMTQAMVAAGEGIALLPRLMLRPRHLGVCIKPLGADAPIRRIVAIRMPTRYLSPSVERFLELLRESGERHAAPN